MHSPNIRVYSVQAQKIVERDDRGINAAASSRRNQSDRADFRWLQARNFHSLSQSRRILLFRPSHVIARHTRNEAPRRNRFPSFPRPSRRSARSRSIAKSQNLPRNPIILRVVAESSI
jgi:hypothetical protein